ncbi:MULTISPECIES: sugar transferase [unclassified Acinetobacter]|uniref:sugar transferase n=1 Tax=unclassified Acinetobacter TaxID=196816 RepID=UPI0035B89AEC
MKQLTLFFKRALDIIGAVCGLIVLSPLFIIVALWIKYDSKGDIFFRQVRVGKHGENFRIHKFRTMYPDSERKSGLTIGKDNRITPSGVFLRKYKVDELAQLIDVLYGDMSLVGPRPEIPEFMNLYAPELREKILSVKPGMTDKASIEMIDENDILGKYDDPRQAYIDVIMPMKAKYYVEYAENISVFRDIKLIIETVIKIVVR